MTLSLAQRRATNITERKLLIIAFIISFLEGYDLVVYGVSVAAILTDPSLGFTPATVGLIGSLTALGMLIGASFAGAATSKLGARKLILGSIVVFFLGMLFSAVAPSPMVFAVGRGLVGIGLGIILPTLLGFVADLSAPARRNRNTGIVMAGYALGGLSAPLIGAALLSEFSFRWMYIIGVIPVFVIFPLTLKMLPDSPVHLTRTGQKVEAEILTNTMGIPMPTMSSEETQNTKFGLGPLLQPGVRAATILFWLTSACGLLLVFGVSTWLPSIMQTAGYDLGPALLLTAMMWVGAGVGMVLGGRIADIVGPKRVVVIAFLAGAASISLMALQPNMVLILILMFISGFGFVGSQALVNGFILSRYPDDLRGSGLSWSLAAGRPGAMIGPVLGAWVLTSGLPFHWNFYSFAIIGVLGAIIALLVPRIAIRNY